MIKHGKNLTTVQKYLCEEFETKFRGRKSFRVHIKKAYLGLELWAKVEPNLSKKLRQSKKSLCKSASIELHDIEKVKKEKIPALCDLCGKTYKNIQSLKGHVSNKHLNERNFKC